MNGSRLESERVRAASEDAGQRLAVLIDADNAPAAVIEGVLAEVARFGEATVKRIYGDFTSPASAQWKRVLNRFAIKPVQQFAYTTGKNATDSTLIIDAMDLLYTRRFDGFCLVSSDSDFTGLALRIREEGLAVYGFGEQKTPEAFRNACHRFIFTEVLRALAEAEGEEAKAKATPINKPDSGSKSKAKQKSKAKPEPAPPKPQSPPLPEAFFRQALEQAGDDGGWANLGTFGSYLTKLRPDFDSRNFGYKKLSDLVKARADLFQTEQRQDAGGKSLYLRAR